MKQAILFAVVAFVVSLAGTAGVLVKTHRPAVAVADSTPTKSDSLPADATSHVIHRDSVPVDSVPRPRDSAAVETPTGGTPEAAPPAGAKPAMRKPTVDPAARAAAYKQVARVLSAMKPPVAAQVMGLLSDDEVEGILRAVGPRQAADFMANIPRARAALLSRRLLVPRPEGQSR
jgi:hypothetical protein